MDGEIKKEFKKWWKEYYTKTNKVVDYEAKDVEEAVKDAFEQGWAEGIVSMMSGAGKLMSKMGHGKPRVDTVASVEAKAKQAGVVLTTIGNILKERKDGWNQNRT